ncbi:MAG: universal stress protein [Saprospiraceae bacterium]|jgi:nucleotide-binding universal stress UspA family protein|nr:universal stress protein [Saprospiraceae bacterium]
MVELKLYGTGTSGYQFLKKSLVDYLVFNQLEYRIEEINDVARFISDNINSVPSVAINGDQPIELSKEGDFKMGIIKLYHRIAALYGKDQMRKILVPTDFSSSASTALHFAKIFCRQKYYSLDLLHVHHPSYIEVAKHPYDEDHSLEAKTELLEKTAKAAEVDFVGDLLGSTPIQAVIKEGLAGDVIIDASPKYEYIIMGSHGASNLFESLLGSVSHRVASESQCPVILVPTGVEFYKLSEICILGKGKESDITAEVMKAFPNIKISHYETNGLAVAVGGYDTHPMDEIDISIEKEDTYFITSMDCYKHARAIGDYTSLEPIYHKIQAKGRPLIVWP